MLKTLKNTLLLTLLLVGSVVLKAAAQEHESMLNPESMRFSVRHYSVADGLSQNTVMSIMEDADGFIWAGTWDGVSRFDGYSFKTYKPSRETTAGSHRVDRLYEDSLGFIWMKTNDGCFYRLNKHTEQVYAATVHDIRFGSRQVAKSTLLEERRGLIWIAGDNKVVRIEEQDGAAGDEVKSEEYSLHGVANFIQRTTNGVCIGTNSGIEIFDKEGQHSYSPCATPEKNNFTAAYFADGVLWLGTAEGKVVRYSDKRRRFETLTLPTQSAINDIVCTGDRLILTTEHDGVAVHDLQTGKTQVFSSATRHDITSNTFSNIYCDLRGDAWCINGQNGVWRYVQSSGELKHYTAEQDVRYENLLSGNFFAFEDGTKRLWINPQGGGFSYFVPELDRLQPMPGGVTNMIHTAYMDRSGIMWVASYDLGLDRISAGTKRFRLTDLRRSPTQPCEMRASLQTDDSTMLLATKDGYATLYDAELRPLGTELQGEMVYALNKRADGAVLYGTKGNGIIIKHEGKTTHFKHRSNDRGSLSSDNIYDLVWGYDSTLYVATYGGGVNILHDGTFLHGDNGWDSYPDVFGAKVRQLAVLDDSTLWAATTNGLLTVNTKTLATHCHPYADLRCIVQTEDGHVWLGSFGGGLIEVLDRHATNVLEKANIRVFDRKNGLLSDIVLAMAEDRSGNLWFTYEEGLSHYDRHEGGFLHFDALNGETSAHFGEAKALVTNSGEIVLGYNKGCCIFDPQNILVSAEAPRIVLTDFLLSGESVATGKDSPLEDNILYTENITLNHNQNFISIEYAALDMSGADKILYSYILEGIDEHWNYVGHERRATYTHLSPGHYTFRVRSTNANGIWADNEQVLHIRIKPSFWTTPWAAMLYLLILIVIIWSVYRNVNTNSRLRQEIEVEQKVTDIKLRFFTNISHELRTPLTLISGPVDNILNNEDVSPSVRNQLEIVNSNAARMLRLINQILDFRKIQNNKMRLSVRELNLTELAKGIFANFTKEASDKHINFRFEDDAPNTLVWADKDKLDTIIYNLISNAFKFTPAAGKVTLHLSQKPDFALIQVSDTGIGIPKEQRNVLFERFSSHNEINNAIEKTGTGIGLNLVKELVNLHHGYIEVESEPGKGTTFTVMLRFGKDHYGQEADIIIEHRPLTENDDSGQDSEQREASFDPKKRNVLAVDDNNDMRAFLKSILEDDYNVRLAADGKEALNIATHHNIDIIVTDLMMPNIDGLELTNRLKNNMSTSHIPIILLTAKSAIESRLTALKYGADDYITKPFSPQYLTARVDNILRQRDRLQETYRALLLLPKEEGKEPEKELTPDEIFLNKLFEFMSRNMDNNALTVDDLVSEMALGRTVFFNKLKSLTGLSPVEYIRDVRLRHAAELLLDDRYNITEVTYMVGMNDSRYFAKCFKNVYGYTPTEYKKNHKNKTDK